ncbi:uncharacterized protein LOC142339571 isoform X2 [Convolutriloba macropyga]|uniref:uncharacterized protein LOC142339571 isoform X2 n=1 Tax=Convolutriloba macropyga TaxID=536237 RepID=UPI003F51E21D
MDPMDDDIFYPDDGGGGGAQPGYYGQPPSTRPTLTSHQIQPEPNPPGCPISEATRFVQLQPPQCPMPSQEPDPQEDPESTIRPAQLETMLQGGTGDFESTWTQSELTEQMRMGSSSVGRDIYDQQDDNTDLFDDLELISDAAGCQTLTVMEQDMIMQHSVPQQHVLPELSNQFLEIHLNSQPQSTTSSTSSVFHSGDVSAAPSGPCDSSQNSPSGVFLSHSTENTSVPIASSSAVTSQSGSQLQRNFSDRQPFSGHLDVKQILKHKLQGKQRDRIQSDPARPLLPPMSPCDLYNQQQHTFQPHHQRPGSVVKFRSPCVSVGTAESLRDDEEASIRRTNFVIERRKERNRQSAARARERQKTKQSDLEQEKAKLSEENASLSREVEALEAERDRLQTLVLSHTSTCTYDRQQDTTSQRHHNQQQQQQQQLSTEPIADTIRTEHHHHQQQQQQQQQHPRSRSSRTYSESFQPSPDLR